MIVSTLTQVRKILPSYNLKSTGTLETRLSDFLARAQEWVTERIIGTDIETLLEQPVTQDGTDSHEKLRLLVQRVICEHAYIEATPEMDLQLSEAGFVVQSNEAMSPASQQRVERLLNSLSERMARDADALVRYLIKNSVQNATYIQWRVSEQFLYLTQCFTPTLETAAEAREEYRDAKWDDFYDAQPRMADALHTTVAGYVSDDEVNAMIEMYRHDEWQPVHRKAARWMRRSVLADIAGKEDDAAACAAMARNVMAANEAAFPEFVESDRYEMPDAFDFGDGTVANML